MKYNILLITAACALVASSVSAATYFHSGAGNWDTTTTNWSLTDATPWTGAAWADNNAATFKGTAGIVTIPDGETRYVTGITFGVQNYRISGGTISLANGASPTTFTLSLSNGNNIFIDSVITGSGGLTMATSATPYLQLFGTNNYTGVTTVKNGTVYLCNDSGLGAAGSGNGTVLESSWAQTQFCNQKATPFIIAEDFTVTGTTSTAAAIYAAYSLGYNTTYKSTGSITLATAGANSVLGATYGTTLEFSGPISLGSANLNLAGRGEGFQALTNQLAGAVITLSGDISGSGAVTSSSKIAQIYRVYGTTTTAYSGLGTVVLSGNNSYTGATTVGLTGTSGFATFIVKSNNALGTTAGATTVNASSSLHLDGSAGSLSIAEHFTINGQGNPTFTGLAFIDTGKTSYTSVALDHGAIRNLAGNNTLSGNITLASASRIDSDQDVLTLGGAISGNFALNIGGAGAVAINGTSAAGTSINVLSGAALAGTGTVNGATTVAADGYVMPGLDGSVGTLTMANLTLNTGAKLAFDLGPIAASDLISMSGSTLAINGLDLTNIDFNILAGAETGVYTLIDAGTITGSLGSNLSTNYMGYDATLSIDTGANNLILTVTAVPEPSTLALLAGGLVGLLAYAWRKRK